MTNEKLVEKVAEIISAGFVTGEEMQPITETARAAIKITGEAILEHQIGVLDVVQSTDIKSLTQGKET